MLNEEEEEQNPNPEATFCKYFSFIFSIIGICLIILKIILTFKTKKKLTIFSLHTVHLVIGIILNVVSFLIQFILGNKNKLPCRLTAIFHISSLNLLINMLFTFYLIALTSVIHQKQTKKISFHIAIYVINWIIIGLFVLFYSYSEPVQNHLDTCRYEINFSLQKEQNKAITALSRTSILTAANVNTIYSFVMLLAICMCFFGLKFSLKKFNSSIVSPSSSKKLDKILETFIVIIVVLLLQFLSFLFNFFPATVLEVVDRVLENIGFMFVLVFLVLPRKELKQCFCRDKEESFSKESDITEEFKESTEISQLEFDY